MPFPADKKAIDIGDYYADTRKIQRAVGWQPAVPLKEGLKRMVRYYREHKKEYW